jgi:CRISPR/Cas system Type II protein with McrA/HNH and RuvC-like nuclease domain
VDHRAWVNIAAAAASRTAELRTVSRVEAEVRENAVSSRRERVLLRDHLRCVYCGEQFPAEELTLDHVEPRMRGGDDSEGNLVSCCAACNRLKGGQAAWSFLSRRPEQRERFMTAVAESDASHAQRVWPRLVRAITEAASAEATRRGRKLSDE